MKCDICGKSVAYGNTVSHSKRHTKRQWKPNIHPATMVIGDKAQHLKICTRCLRNQKKVTGPA